MDATTILAIICGLISAASAFCACTATPAPDTTWGKVYRLIEVLALLVGKAKQDGLIEHPTRLFK